MGASLFSLLPKTFLYDGLRLLTALRSSFWSKRLGPYLKVTYVHYTLQEKYAEKWEYGTNFLFCVMYLC